jgi:hypothetical protein
MNFLISYRRWVDSFLGVFMAVVVYARLGGQTRSSGAPEPREWILAHPKYQEAHQRVLATAHALARARNEYEREQAREKHAAELDALRQVEEELEREQALYRLR